MAESNQFGVLYGILQRFQKAGILQDLMLVGSWCLHFYRIEFKNSDEIPAVRTMDADFLIPNIYQLKKECNVAQILKEEGFLPSHNRESGLVKYDHPELRIEFLVPELGRGHDNPLEVKKLGINAQGLRYLNFLTDYPKIISYRDMRIKVPEPAAFALHKFIISGRRLNKEKAKRDLEMAVGLLEFLYEKPREVARIKSILRDIPAKWRKSILLVSNKCFPNLNDTAKKL